MSDAELEQLIQTLQKITLEDFLEEEKEDGEEGETDFASQIVLRPPATPQQIEECENFLGRRFPPSYRHFLSLHNGWRSCQGYFHFLGTEDYKSEEVRNYIAVEHQGYLLGSSAPVDNLPLHIFYPEVIYRLCDSTANVSSELQPLKESLDNYEEGDGVLCLPKHTRLSINWGGGNQFLFLVDKTSDDLEQPIVEYFHQGGRAGDWPNFYVLLETLIEAGPLG